MEWRDQGIIINIKPHGEHGGVVSLLTQNNGRHAGFTHGVQSSKNRSQYELGTLVDAEWISRREERQDNNAKAHDCQDGEANRQARIEKPEERLE